MSSNQHSRSPVRHRPLVEVVEDSDRDASALVELVNAELVDDTQPGMPTEVIDAILNSYLVNGRLVPARSAVLEPGAESNPEQARRQERARLLDEMRANALADGTLRGYGGHVRAWQSWCRREEVPALPLDPGRVANFLLDYALDWDLTKATYRRNSDGELLASVAMGTVDGRLKALNKLAEFTGLPRPGDNAGVKEVMSGLRRRFGTASRGKAALDLKLLKRCLTAAQGIAYTDARGRVAHLLRARTSATAGQLATLCWAEVHLDADTVSIRFPKTHRYGQATTITVAAHRNPDLCLLTALRNLQGIAPRMREVLTHRTGKPLTRQALHAALAEVWDVLPSLPDARLAPLLEVRCSVTPNATARDQALLLVGFYTALRRSNLSALNWGDLKDHGEDGWSAYIGWSKTDQEGGGRISWVPAVDGDGLLDCPAEALRDWRSSLTRALGREPRPDEPVFVSLTNSGTVKQRQDGRVVRLPGEAMNEVVQRLAVAAGLAKTMKNNPYGAHSLRSGFVTESVRDDKLSILEVMEVTGHKTPAMVVRYRKEVNSPKSNAARKLMNILNQQ